MKGRHCLLYLIVIMPKGLMFLYLGLTTYRLCLQRSRDRGALGLAKGDPFTKIGTSPPTVCDTSRAQTMHLRSHRLSRSQACSNTLQHTATTIVRNAQAGAGRALGQRCRRRILLQLAKRGPIWPRVFQGLCPVS